MTTQTKHDGYAVFLPNGDIYLPSIRIIRSNAIDSFMGASAWERDYEPYGYTVRPVTITEVKDDE